MRTRGARSGGDEDFVPREDETRAEERNVCGSPFGSGGASVHATGRCDLRARHGGAAATLALAALAAGLALAAFVVLLRPEPVAVVAGLVLSRYVALGLFIRSCARLARAEEAVASDPTRAELYFELAFARLERGRAGDAVRAFRQGVGLDPELAMERPAELTERLLLSGPARGQETGRRKALAYLITAALFERMLENLEDTLPAGLPAAPQGAAGFPVSGAGPGPEERLSALSVRDVARRLKGSARERFLEHCRSLVHSLRLEIAGLEQLVVALDGDEEGILPTGFDRDRQRRRLEHEIERLRAHAGEIDSAIRLCTRDRGQGA